MTPLWSASRAEVPTGVAVDTALRDAPLFPVTLGPHVFPNPVMTASGCAGVGPELQGFFPLGSVGALVTPTVTHQPRSGLGTPRLVETPSGLLNAVGVQSSGIDLFVREDLAWLHGTEARVVVSIGGSSPQEYAAVARSLATCPYRDTIVGLEANISSPWLSPHGIPLAADPRATALVMAAVASEVPAEWLVSAKLSAEVPDVVQVAAAAVLAGATALTAINTVTGMVIDTRRLRPLLMSERGGLSGPAIRPLAVRVVWDLYAAMSTGIMPSVPIIGSGGVASGVDALEFVAAGASAVQVGTAALHDVGAPLRVARELRDEVQDLGFAALRDVVGIAHTRRCPLV